MSEASFPPSASSTSSIPVPVSWLPDERESRRAFLLRLGLMLPVLGAGGVTGMYGYSSLLERHRVVVEKYPLSLDLGSRAPQRCRVIGMTDFHFDPLHETAYLQRCVTLANAQQPDLIVLTGDYITRSSRRVAELAEVLGGLRAKGGVYACLGNHDHWHEPHLVTRALEKQGIRVLQNEHTRVPAAGGEVLIAGLQSVWGGRPDWSRAARGLRKEDRVLMLMHEPDYAATLSHDPRIVLQCSGHTHGGQVRVPGWGALILPRYGKNYPSGLYQVRKLQLQVNRGLGTVDKHVRFCCPPEIACMDIQNLEAASEKG